MNENLLWIWLAEACRPGSDNWGRLRNAGMTPRDVYRAEPEVLREVIGPRRKAVLAALSDRDLTAAEQILNACLALKIRVIPYDGDEFPDSLRSLDDPPAVLYAVGAARLSELPLPIAMVGTRHVTTYGCSQSHALAGAFARAGATVVSGLALGVDGMSQASAVAAGGITVAVIACGLDTVYPESHRRLARAMCKHGAVVSEYPPGIRAERFRFPERNRIVSGLSRATVVVEGTADSGALITAECAMAQGRPVYALPGRADDDTSAASFSLLRRGARLLLSPDELLADFGAEREGLTPPDPTPALTWQQIVEKYGVSASGQTLCPPAPAPAAPAAQSSAPLPAPDLPPADLGVLSTAGVSLLYAIPAEGSCLPDELMERADPATVTSQLTLLELSGMIRRLPSGRICRLVSLP